ncbi:MAG: Brp/Blh family beta-carotene 15,15'-dioxygenase [Nonlabens sp.]
MKRLYAIISIFSIVGYLLGLFVSSDVLSVLGLLLVVTVGLLHGSNDIYLLRRLNTAYGVIAYSLIYAVVVLSFGIAFYFFPVISLLLFVLVSGYHFGEQHWYRLLGNLQIKWVKQVFYITYGLLVLSILFLGNTVEVIQIINDLTGYSLPTIFFEQFFYAMVMVTLAGSIYLLFKKVFRIGMVALNVLLSLLLYIVFQSGDLIWGFSFYFVLWHSIPSLFDQILFKHNQFKIAYLFSFFKESFPYWLLSIISLALFYYFFKDSRYALSILFAFIASVTVPHVLIMTSMFTTKHKS